jgi:hypothetical protein
MSTTIFLSKPSYLPIYQSRDDDPFGSSKHTDVWRNFIASLDVRDKFVLRFDDQLRKWNGRLINDVVVFDSDKDKMWFILRWS